MSLLVEIQNAAVDSKSDLGTLLRKCKLLAARLGSQPLEDWLLWESNGYPEDVDVPDYRIWPLELKGHFAGPFGSGIRNAPIPWVCLPEKTRDAYQNYKCRQSIASIEELLRSSDKGTLRVSTADLAVALGTKVYQYQNCVQAWAEFGAGNLIELLNTVRNRILDFTLAIWKEAPTAGEHTDQSEQKIEANRVTQIFNTTVYGGTASLVGSASDSSITFSVLHNDFASLEGALRANSITENDINDLKTAIQTDGQIKKKGIFGPRVSSWIAGMIKKAANGSWNIGVGAAGNLLAQVISKYYGL